MHDKQNTKNQQNIKTHNSENQFSYSPPPSGLMKFSWILQDKLAVGPAPRDYETLQGLGFSAAVNLQEKSEGGPFTGPIPPGFEAVQIPIEDGVVGGIPTVVQVTRSVEAVHGLLKSHKVYVHCYAGVGRSPMVCIAYLAQFEGMKLEEAIKFVSQRHYPASPNDCQLAVVSKYLESNSL